MTAIVLQGEAVEPIEATIEESAPPRPPVPRDLGDFLVAAARAQGLAVHGPAAVAEIHHDRRSTIIYVMFPCQVPNGTIASVGTATFELRLVR